MVTLVDQDPHANSPVVTGCTSSDNQELALVLLHGRGGTPQDMLALATIIDCMHCACIALQATDYSWYPYSFLEPLNRNEPWLSSALARIDGQIKQLNDDGLPSSRIALAGFSQGACLALEYAVRHPRRFGAIIGLSGGLIGPPGTTWDQHGGLEGTPVFLGCSDMDPHIPRERVEETARIFKQMGGYVTMRLYPHMGHTVNQDEIDFIREMLNKSYSEIVKL